jgi:hypothetical protein
MSDKSDAIAVLETARKELLAAVDGVPQEKMTVPFLGEWSVKDILAHVSSWDELDAGDFPRLARGHVPLQAAFREEEANDWNAFLMRGRRLFSLPQVMFELEHQRQVAREALDALPDAVFAQGQMVRTFCDMTVDHDCEHAGHIRDWRQNERI